MARCLKIKSVFIFVKLSSLQKTNLRAKTSLSRGNIRKCVTSHHKLAFPAVQLLIFLITCLSTASPSVPDIPIVCPWLHAWLQQYLLLILKQKCIQTLNMILVSEWLGFPHTWYLQRRHLQKWENARKSCHTALNRFLCSGKNRACCNISEAALHDTRLFVTFQLCYWSETMQTYTLLTVYCTYRAHTCLWTCGCYDISGLMGQSWLYIFPHTPRPLCQTHTG